MTDLSTLSVARNRAAIMEELRRLLPGMAGLCTPLPLGLAAIDSHLPQGGLAAGALHEVVPDGQGAIPSALGFIAAILARIAVNSPPPPGPRLPRAYPSFFVLPAYGLRHAGRLSGHGLAALGLDPARLVVVETAHWRETLWAMEEALHSRAPAAVAGIIDKLDLRLSQRLHLAAMDSGLPLFVLRPAAPQPSSAAYWGASAAATRWRVGTARAVRDRFGLITRARWHLVLERCRNGRAGEWTVEYDHVAHRFSLAATLADPAGARGTEQKFVELSG